MSAVKQLDFGHFEPMLDQLSKEMFPSMRIAREAGKVAAQACAEKAEREGFDTEGAREFVLAYLRERTSAAGEDITLAAKAAGFVPHDDRAFGAVFGTLLRRGQIECVGHVARKRGHGTAGGRVWAVVR